jgi:DNA-binding transcriptional LysR family regulator
VEIRQLRYFLTVAEELHFGRAARRLHIVQSAVSQQLRRLERELGVELFDRTTRSVRLTGAGELLLPHAEEVLAAVARAESAVDAYRGTRAATVRLGSSSGLGARLDTIFDRFALLAPESRLELVTAPTAERLTRVRDGELDATLLRGDRPHPGLELLELWRDELVAALPARCDWPDEVALAALAGLPLRLSTPERNPALFELVTGCCREAGFERVLGPEFTTDQDTLATIGFGSPSWTVYYRAQADQLSAPGVAFRPLRDPVPALTTYLAVRPGPPRAAVRALIGACHAAARAGG